MTCISCSRPLPDGARFCPFCGHEVMGTITEERRIVTALFADIVGYTALSEHRDPERVKRLVDGAVEVLAADINEFGGRVDKVVGDGIVAIFGAPVAHEDDPDRAIRAALRMHDSIATFSEGRSDLASVLQLRVGINTGEVVVGSISGTDDYTAMGDVVNVASRLQSIAPPGSTYIGDATAEGATDQIVRELVEDAVVRGRTQTEHVWRVVGVRPRLPYARLRSDLPFVGRANQQELLRSVMTMVSNGRSAIVSVTGEVGIGKTRLVQEMLSEFPSRRVTVFAGVCAPYGERNAWSPITTALSQSLGLEEELETGALRAQCRERAVSRYGFDLDDPIVDRFVEVVMHLLGRPSELDGVDPRAARESLFRLIVEGLRRRSRTGPIVVWIDDLQWADPLLTDLLHRLARSLVDRPLLLITAQRDDADVDWPPVSDQPITIRMPLEPLSEVEAERLVGTALGSTTASLTGKLYERSGGNPLYLTELVELAESGDAGGELPRSLRALIAARLDRLAPGPRRVLDNAAVLGATGVLLSLGRFAEALGQSFDPKDVDELVDEGLLEIVGYRWHFRSDIVREVAYQMLTKLVRAQRHAGVATAMSALGAPVDQVAHHAATSAELVAEIGPVAEVPPDIRERAVDLLLAATRSTLQVGGLNEALRHADRALALGPADDGVRRELLVLRAEASTALRQVEAGRADSEAALAAALEAGDLRHEGMARRFVGTIDHIAGRLDDARIQLARSVEIFREIGDDIELAASLREQGFAEVFGGSLEHADRLLHDAEELSERLDDRRGRAWVRQHQAWVAFLSGDLRLAEERLMSASAEFAELGDRSGGNWATGMLAFLRFFDLRFEEAEALAVAVRAEGVELGETWGEAMMDTLIASIRLWNGAFVEAEALAKKALIAFRELGDRFGLVLAHGARNRALVSLGRDRDAERGLEEMLSLAETSGDLAFPMVAAAGTAVHLGLGEHAVVLGENAVELMNAMKADGSEARVTYALALCQAGRPEEALVALEDVNVVFPYAYAVRALAAALCGDDEGPLADAAAVAAREGASFLDRIIADLGAATAEVRVGDRDAAAERLERAGVVAMEEGGVVAQTLCAAAREALGIEGVAEPETGPTAARLRTGWQTVLAALARSTAAAGRL